MFFAVCGVAPLCRPSLSSTVNAPSPFLLFFYFIYFINLLDTRLRFALTAYSSLKHSLKSVSLSHTQIHTLHPPSQKRTHSFNSIGGENIAIGWDLFPNAHRWRCEAFGLRSTSGALDLWAILLLFFLHFFFVHLLNPALGKLTKIWITHFVYSYSWRPFRLSRAGNSQHRRCEYCTAENSLLAF